MCSFPKYKHMLFIQANEELTNIRIHPYRSNHYETIFLETKVNKLLA